MPALDVWSDGLQRSQACQQGWARQGIALGHIAQTSGARAFAGGGGGNAQQMAARGRISGESQVGLPQWTHGVEALSVELTMERLGASRCKYITQGSARALSHVTASPRRRAIVTLRSFAPYYPMGAPLLGCYSRGLSMRPWPTLTRTTMGSILA
jgi:hypothetical protein